MSKQLKNYIFVVDTFKPRRYMSKYRMSLRGRYRVGATSKDKAFERLRKYIGKFGGIRLLYECEPNDLKAKLGEIIIEHKHDKGKEMTQSGVSRKMANVRYADYPPFNNY